MNKDKVTIVIFQNDDRPTMELRAKTLCQAKFDGFGIDLLNQNQHNRLVEIKVIKHSETPWRLEAQHDTAVTQFSEKNMVAVKKDINPYRNKYFIEPSFDFGDQKPNLKAEVFSKDHSKEFFLSSTYVDTYDGEDNEKVKAYQSWWKRYIRSPMIWKRKNKGIS